MKQLFFVILLATQSLEAAVVQFSDSVNVVTGPPPLPYTLDFSSYPNTVIGQGLWQVAVDPSSVLGSFDVLHYISLFSTGTLDRVTVTGTAASNVRLVANLGTPVEQTFLGSSTTTAYDFNLSGYNMDQEDSTLLTGFTSISKITFTGSINTIPEPSAFIFTSMAKLTIVMRRKRTKH